MKRIAHLFVVIACLFAAMPALAAIPPIPAPAPLAQVYVNRVNTLRAQGLVPVANKNVWYDQTTSGASGGITVYTRHTLVYPVTGVAMLYGNYDATSTSGDVDGPSTLTVNAGLEYCADLTKISRVSAGGATDITIQPGGTAVTNPVGIDCNAGDNVIVRTWESDGVTTFPFGYGVTTAAWGEGRNSGVNNSNSGAATTGPTGGYAPLVILGYTSVPNPRALCIFGDSISHPLWSSGQGDGAEPQRGFIQYAAGTSIPAINLGRSGETSATFQGRARQYRMQIAKLCTGAIVEYGTNDIFASFLTAVATEANNASIIAAAHKLGISPVCVTTLAPRVTLTLGGPDQAHQATITSGGAINPEAERESYNTYVRASYAAMGADCLVDSASKVEVNSSNVLTLNGGFWKTGASAGLVSGTATAGSTTTMTDTSKAWTVNAYAGYQVYISGGTGSGQVRNIYTNTATAVTVSSSWTTNPDATSTYTIEDWAPGDGIHPSTPRVIDMATAINLPLFTN